MASLTRPPPPLLRPTEISGANRPSQLSPLGLGRNQCQCQGQEQTINKDQDCFPTTQLRNRGVGDTPMNTPAFMTIAPRLNLGGGRPIGGGSGFGKAAHAATPGNPLVVSRLWASGLQEDCLVRDLLPLESPKRLEHLLLQVELGSLLATSESLRSRINFRS